MVDRVKDISDRSEDAAYVAPEIVTYSPEEFLKVIGPAQGYGGGDPGPGRGDTDRVRRMFPGLR
ncbi:MAG: hypothetical protein JSV80_15360 [Acidobacteriota bacterium]|nr:MAG: hypothetical protein JSV80_15360 [Acidobacteriota bacterium]